MTETRYSFQETFLENNPCYPQIKIYSKDFIVGEAQFIEWDKLPTQVSSKKPILYLESIRIDADLQGKGLGTMLLLEANKFITMKDALGLTYNGITAEHPADFFHNRHGWKEVLEPHQRGLGIHTWSYLYKKSIAKKELDKIIDTVNHMMISGGSN